MERKRRIVPPVYLALTLAAMAALHYWWPLAGLIAWPFRWIGVAPLFGGLLMTITSAASFRRAGTPLIPFERSTTLVTGGWYRYTRNPMYLGMVLLLTGIAILLGTATPFLPIPVFIGIIQARFIRGEERFLEELFGADYLAFKARVRRWL